MSKVSKTPELKTKAELPPTPKKLCNWVTNNAFDFLGKGIDEFQTDSKYSVIHFCTGVELFLKARLMKEHWSLVVRDMNKADWNDFIKGKCNSVTLEESFLRLAKIANEPISQKKVFMDLADHRNRILHFDHELNRNVPQALRDVASEQCKAWHIIKSLLTEHWKEHFKQLQSKIDELDLKMRKHRAYLQVVFESDYESDIKEEIAQGVIYNDCSSCGNHSAKVMVLLEQPSIQREMCKVCGYDSYPYLVFNCIQCEGKVIFQDENGSCEKCKKEYDIEEVKDILSTTHEGMRNSDIAFTDWEFNCSWCDGYHTVIRNNESFICLNCLEDSDRIESCGWCGEGSINLQDFSGAFGCSQCEGSVGYQLGKDD